MTALFNRDVAVTVGTLRIAARPEGNEEQVKPTLRMTFKVEKSLNRDPNKADLKIWNLSEKSRKAMQTEEKLPVIIEAGSMHFYSDPPPRNYFRLGFSSIDCARI